MVKINGTTIRMTKGDTLRVMLMLEDENGFDYIPEDGDQIRFAMKESYDDAEPLILKEISIESMILTLEPKDTKNLEAPMQYVYDIEITYANGDVDTFIDKAKLVLTEEVY